MSSLGSGASWLLSYKQPLALPLRLLREDSDFPGSSLGFHKSGLTALHLGHPG